MVDIKITNKVIRDRSFAGFKERIGFIFLLVLGMMLLFSFGFMMIFSCIYAKEFNLEIISMSILTALFWLIVVFPFYKSFYAVVASDYYLKMNNVNLFGSLLMSYVRSWVYPLGTGFRILLNLIIGAGISVGLYFGFKYLTIGIAYNLDENIRIMYETIKVMQESGESISSITTYYLSNAGYFATLVDILQIIGINIGVLYFLIVTGYYHIYVSVILQGIGPKMPIRAYYTLLRITRKEKRLPMKRYYFGTNWFIFVGLIALLTLFNSIFYVYGNNYFFGIAISIALTSLIGLIVCPIFIYNALGMSHIIATAFKSTLKDIMLREFAEHKERHTAEEFKSYIDSELERIRNRVKDEFGIDLDEPGPTDHREKLRWCVENKQELDVILKQKIEDITNPIPISIQDFFEGLDPHEFDNVDITPEERKWLDERLKMWEEYKKKNPDA